MAERRPNLVAFGLRLKASRESAGYSQAELSRKSGVHAVTISRLESGLLDPTLSTLVVLAASLSVSVGELAGDRPGA